MNVTKWVVCSGLKSWKGMRWAVHGQIESSRLGPVNRRLGIAV